MITDGAGRAISFALAPGQAHELPLAPDLVDCLPDIPGVGDKGYASHAFRLFIWDQAGDPGQEQRSTRGLPGLDLQQSQPCRAPVGAPQGVARPRYEKTAASFMGVLCLAAVFDWIKQDFKL